MKIYMFLAEGFEETEMIAPLDLLLRAGADIKTAAITENKHVLGAHGIEIKADSTVNEIDLTDFDGIILPGGGKGTENLFASKEVKAAVEHAYNSGKLIGAICAAPTVLGRMGLLKDKTAVCFPSMTDMLYCKDLAEAGVACDGNIITARGMGVSYQFGLALVKYFYGEEKAKELKNTTCGE